MEPWRVWWLIVAVGLVLLIVCQLIGIPVD